MAVQLAHYRFTRAEYHRMVEAGILTEESPVELIEGEIVRMSPIGPHHAGAVDYLTRLFFRRVGDLAHIRIQNPIRLSHRSEPEPDLALLRPYPERDRPYAAAHPTPADVLLVVEVAESSVAYDLGRKARVYARHGIAELWVLDLRHDRLVVFRDPTPRGYTNSRILGRGESITLLAFPEIALTVDEILG